MSTLDCRGSATFFDRINRSASGHIIIIPRTDEISILFAKISLTRRSW